MMSAESPWPLQRMGYRRQHDVIWMLLPVSPSLKPLMGMLRRMRRVICPRFLMVATLPLSPAEAMESQPDAWADSQHDDVSGIAPTTPEEGIQSSARCDVEVAASF